MYVTANGISTFVERSGAGEPVVLVHPLGGSTRGWDTARERLSVSHDVIAHDWRGHGLTEQPTADFDMHDLASDLAELLRGLGVESACLVGVAVGAAIALQTAVDHPGCVSSLVLVAGCGAVEERVAHAMRTRARTVEAEGMRVAVDDSVLAAFAPAFLESHTDLIERYRGDFLANSPRGYAAAVRAFVEFDVTAGLPYVRCPTTLLVGELDPYFPPAVSERLCDDLGGVDLTVLPGVGHFSNIEAPLALAEAVETFLDDLRT